MCCSVAAAVACGASVLANVTLGDSWLRAGWLMSLQDVHRTWCG